MAETEYTLRINGEVTDEYQGRKIKYLHYNGNDYKIKAVVVPWGGTDLRGTTWRFNLTSPKTPLTIYGSEVSFNISTMTSFVSRDGVPYSNISYPYVLLTAGSSADYGSSLRLQNITSVTYNNYILIYGDGSSYNYFPTNWNSRVKAANYMDVQFTGGTDYSNASFISWLRANATLIDW